LAISDYKNQTNVGNFLYYSCKLLVGNAREGERGRGGEGERGRERVLLVIT
jgi:hypothetical protein